MKKSTLIILVTLLNLTFAHSQDFVKINDSKTISQNAYDVLKQNFKLSENISYVKVQNGFYIDFDKQKMGDTLGNVYKFDKNLLEHYYPSKNKKIFLGKARSRSMENEFFEFGLYDLNQNLIKSFDYNNYYLSSSLGKNSDIYYTKYGDFTTFFKEQFSYKLGLIDQEGNVVFEAIYDEIFLISSRYFILRKDGKTIIYDLEDKTFTNTEPFGIAKIEYFYDIGTKRRAIDDKLIVIRGQKYGVFDFKTKKLIVPCIYENIEFIKKNIPFDIGMKYPSYQECYLTKYFYLFKNNKKGIINTKNEIIVLPDFEEFDFNDKSDKFIDYRKDHTANVYNYKTKKYFFEKYSDKFRGIGEYTYFVHNTSENLNQIYDLKNNVIIKTEKKLKNFEFLFGNVIILISEDDTKYLYNTDSNKFIYNLSFDSFKNLGCYENVNNIPTYINCRDYLLLKNKDLSYIINSECEIIVSPRKLYGLLYIENNYFVNYLTEQKKMILNVFDLKGNQIDINVYKTSLKTQ